MSARDRLESFMEFDDKPGTSSTDIVATVVVLLMVAVIVWTVVMVTARAIEAASDPAVPACEQAIAEGYYTVELYGQCLGDYHDAVTP